MPCWSFDDVIAAVRSGKAGYAVLPVHNEIIGEIRGVRASIARSGLEALGEVHAVIAADLAGEGRGQGGADALRGTGDEDDG